MCFTGHRPNKLPGRYDKCHIYLKNPLKEELQRIKERYNITKAYCGMALGFDQIAAAVCLDLDIPVVASIPCKNYESKWPKFSRDIYNSLLESIESSGGEIIYLKDNYTPSCLQIRNIYMVDHSAVVLACWDGSDGGTSNCIDYAKRQCREIINMWTLLKAEVEKQDGTRIN
jgi:uncharacterized phage-like protein YoqJ